MSYVKRTWTVENTWVCDSCSQKNLGRHMKCQKCGSYKESREKYDTSKNLSSPAVTNPELLVMAKAGPNWECSYCKNSVRNLYGECSVCGGPKTEQAEKEIRQTSKNNAVKNSNTNIQNKSVEPIRYYNDNVSPKPVDPFWNENNKQLGFIGIGALGIISFAFLMFWLFGYHNQHTTISNTYWSHTAHLEQRYTRHGVGWEDDAPAGHFNNICETRQHGTHDCNPYDCNPHSVSYECNCHSVSDGESCSTSCHDNGNGFSECEERCTPQSHTECDTCSRTEYDTCYEQCSTMEQWCSYDYYQWNVIATSQTSGHNDHNLTDPSDIVARTTSHGPQRVTVDRHYSVTFVDLNDDEKPHWEYNPVNASDFNRFNVGDHWLIETNRAGNMNPLHIENRN